MSSARHRTVAHMHHMLAATTAAIGCTRGDVQTVTITPLPTVPVSATGDPTPPPPPTVPPTTSVATVQPPINPVPSGYLVVDMLPAPARCMGLATASHVSGKFTRASGAIVLELVVTLPTSGKLGGTKFDGSSSAWSGNVSSTSFRNHNTMVVARIVPMTGATTSIGATFGVSCAGAGNGTLGVTAALSGAPADGMIPTLTLQDY